jgi:hypothetical protein
MSLCLCMSLCVFVSLCFIILLHQPFMCFRDHCRTRVLSGRRSVRPSTPLSPSPLLSFPMLTFSTCVYVCVCGCVCGCVCVGACASLPLSYHHYYSSSSSPSACVCVCGYLSSFFSLPISLFRTCSRILLLPPSFLYSFYFLPFTSFLCVTFSFPFFCGSGV